MSKEKSFADIINDIKDAKSVFFYDQFKFKKKYDVILKGFPTPMKELVSKTYNGKRYTYVIFPGCINGLEYREIYFSKQAFINAFMRCESKAKLSDFNQDVLIVLQRINVKRLDFVRMDRIDRQTDRHMDR